MSPSSPPATSGDSRRVVSNQPNVHAGLEALVRRHLAAPWRQPLHAPSVTAFEQVEALRRAAGTDRPVVLDSGCGTGESTRRLAERHPDALVVGVDRSAARLQRVGADRAPLAEGNALWVRAELASFWRLALDAGWPVTHHYLLYPNPWPKAAQLSRRWHGHPVFPDLLALGGRLELRSNWSIYVREFGQAVTMVTGTAAPVRRLGAAQRDEMLRTGQTDQKDPMAQTDQEALTPFERKYAASGHDLWALVAELT